MNIKLKDLLNEKIAKVPGDGYFKNEKEAEKFMKNIGANHAVDKDVINNETGEVYMEKGDTKSKLAKKSNSPFSAVRQKFNDMDEWDLYYFEGGRSGINQEFEKYFNVVYKDNGKDMDDKEKEMFTSGDYEWDFKYPSKIKRKDGKPFTTNDKENIERFGDWFGTYVLSGGNIKLSTAVGKNMATGEPQFI